MFRRNQLLGVFLVGLGIGISVACRCESPFWWTCFGFGAVIIGICLLQKNGRC